MAAAPTAVWSESEAGIRLALGGDWTTTTIDQTGWRQSIPPTLEGRPLAVEMAAIQTVDSNGALFLAKWLQTLEDKAAAVELVDPPSHLGTISRLLAEQEPADTQTTRPGLLDRVETIGKAAVDFGKIAIALIAFMGEVTVSLLRAIIVPGRMRFKSIVYHMQQAGVAALPIVGLLSFLIGIVTAYQGADQLARFGAAIFTVNLIGVGVLREMGALITAIIVAGRSASAFAAQIGTMKINEEVDALQVIGIDPMIVLVVPRVLALILIFPFLVIYADAMGVLGGAIMVTMTLDITFSQFVSQFQSGVSLDHFWVGLSKAPLFAGAIAGIGCYQGLQVSQGAAAVGEKTSAAVVQAIFLVIVIDAMMSIIFSILGV